MVVDTRPSAPLTPANDELGPSAVGRRAALVGLAAGAAVVTGAAAVAAYLRPPLAAEIDLGDVGAFPMGTVRHFRPDGSGGLAEVRDANLPDTCDGGRGMFVVRRADGFVALSDRCTHLGAVLKYRDRFAVGASCSGPVGGPLTCVPQYGQMPSGRGDALYCFCHGSQFNPDDGSAVQGPAPAPLDVVPLRVVGGRLLVNVDPSLRHRRGPGEDVKATPA